MTLPEDGAGVGVGMEQGRVRGVTLLGGQTADQGSRH